MTLLGTALRTWSRRDALLRVGAGLGLAVGAVIGLQVTTAVIDRTGLGPPAGRTDAAFPVSHFLMMGASEKPGPFNNFYGAYRDEDALATLAVPPGEQRERHGFEEYRRRVSAMGPVGYARFLNAKATWTLGDGSFFMYGEGSMAAVPTPFVHSSALDQQIQSFLGLHGNRFWMVVDTWQAFWLVVLLLMAAPLVAARPRPRLSPGRRDARRGLGPAALRALLRGSLEVPRPLPAVLPPARLDGRRRDRAAAAS